VDFSWLVTWLGVKRFMKEMVNKTQV